MRNAYKIISGKPEESPLIWKHCVKIGGRGDNIEIYFIKEWNIRVFTRINPLTPNDDYSGRTAPLTSKRFILYIYSKNTGTEYFKHGIYYPFFSLQNAVCFIILTYLVPVLFTFYIQSVLKFKKNNNSGAKRLNWHRLSSGSVSRWMSGWHKMLETEHAC